MIKSVSELGKDKLFETVNARRSVRTFDGNGLTAEDQQELLDFANNVANPYGQSVAFQIFSAKEHNLASPVIAGTDLFMTGKLLKQPHAEEAFGYSMEEVVLFAQSKGIGTTWIAGTMNRDAFEKAAGLVEGERMPCVSPLGHPAAKMGLKESLMRKGVKADSRIAFEKLFFKDSFDTPLKKEDAGDLADALEAVRWAPSAVNKQPWRAVVCGSVVHFYEHKDKGYDDGTWDLQKVDLGIALQHYMAMLCAFGKVPQLRIEDPGIACPAGSEYIATVEPK